MANREIQYNQIGPVIEEQLEKLMQVTVFEADKALKKASPVDTGRFRASWQVSQGVESLDWIVKIGYRLLKIEVFYFCIFCVLVAEPAIE